MSEPTASRGLSRRAILKSGVAGAALAFLGGAGLALQSSKLRPLPRGGLATFSPEEYATLAAIAVHACPAPRAGVLGADAIGVAAEIDAMFANAEDDLKAGLKMGLRIVESGLAGAVFLERVKPFTQLSHEDQQRVLVAMRDSKVAVRRQLFRAFTGLASGVYYGDPRTWPSIGYPGPPDPAAFRAAYSANLVDLRALEAPRPRGEG